MKDATIKQIQASIDELKEKARIECEKNGQTEFFNSYWIGYLESSITYNLLPNLQIIPKTND